MLESPSLSPAGDPSCPKWTRSGHLQNFMPLASAICYYPDPYFFTIQMLQHLKSYSLYLPSCCFTALLISVDVYVCKSQKRKSRCFRLAQKTKTGNSSRAMLRTMSKLESFQVPNTVAAILRKAFEGASENDNLSESPKDNVCGNNDKATATPNMCAKTQTSNCSHCHIQYFRQASVVEIQYFMLLEFMLCCFDSIFVVLKFNIFCR